MEHTRLSGLDGLRGIAAISILLFHAFGARHGNAFLAVDFFFMLSGFVMARTYEGRLRGDLSAQRFLALRIARLWPTMFVAGLIAAPVFLWSYGSGTWPVIVANLLLIPFPLMNRAYPLNGPAWSILCELFANAVHAAGLHRVSTPRLALIAGVAFLCVARFASKSGTFDLGSTPLGIFAGFPRVILGYVIGIILFRLWADRPPVGVSPAFSFLAMPVFFATSAATSMHHWFSDLLFVVFVCPLIIAGGLRVKRAWPVASFAGAISFPLYAVHVPITGWTDKFGIGPFGMIATSLAFATGIAWAQGAWTRRHRKDPHDMQNSGANRRGYA